MTRGPETVWNKEALGMLLDMLREEEEEDDSIPRRSDDYLMIILSNRLTALQRPWKKSQKRKKSDGKMETPEENATRVYLEDEDERQGHRKTQRRVKVSLYIKDRRGTTDLDEVMGQTRGHSSLYDRADG
jgi:hypothetical protein